MPRSVRTVRWSAGSPTCQPPVPELSTVAFRPSSSMDLRSTCSAMGERQMLPVQTKVTRYGPRAVVSGM